MASFQDQLKKAEILSEDVVTRDLFDFIRELEKVMADMNRDQINEKSQDIYGNAIGFYSKATEYMTGGNKRAGEPFDGEDTGSWLKGFYADVLDGYVTFGSTDPKTGDILSSEHWLSKDLFGLNDQNLQNLIKRDILPFMQNYYRQKLDL